MIVTVTPTVIDGLVVRWYTNATAARDFREQVSASRNGVLVDGYLHLVPDEVLVAAKKAHFDLRHGEEDDVRALATHVRRFFSSHLEPVTEVADV